jgi:hypothetical protein
MRLNRHPENLRVGQKVTTEFYAYEEQVIRRIVDIVSDPNCSCGFKASADGGIPCPACGHYLGKEVRFVDAAWFLPVEEE